MKKILLQLDSDRTASVFDAVTAYDAGADVLLQHGSVEPAEVRAIVYGACSRAAAATSRVRPFSSAGPMLRRAKLCSRKRVAPSSGRSGFP